MVRLDVLLAERGLVETRSRAQALVHRRAGARRRPGGDQGRLERRGPTRALDVDHGPPFVSRGGDKLADGARRLRRRRRRVSAASTSAPRRAASPTACCSAAPRGRARSTSDAVSCTSACRQDDRVRDPRGRQRPGAGSRDAAVRRRRSPSIDVSFISLSLVLPAVLACLERALALPAARQAAVRGRPRTGAGAGSCAIPRCSSACSSALRRRSRSSEQLRWTPARRASQARRATASSSCTSSVATIQMPPSRPETSLPASLEPSLARAEYPRALRAFVVTHGRAETVGDGLRRLARVAALHDVELIVPDIEAKKHPVDLASATWSTGEAGMPTSSWCSAATARCCARCTQVIGTRHARPRDQLRPRRVPHDRERRRARGRRHLRVHRARTRSSTSRRCELIREGERVGLAVNDVVVTSALHGRMAHVDWWVNDVGPRRGRLRRCRRRDAGGLDRATACRPAAP